jgi:hypothetical protein
MENPGEGNDTVYALVEYTIGPNIEGLVLFEGAENIFLVGTEFTKVYANTHGSTQGAPVSEEAMNRDEHGRA